MIQINKLSSADLASRRILSTEEAAFMLNRQSQTLRVWACKGNGPIQPIKIYGRLAWKVEDIKKLLE